MGERIIGHERTDIMTPNEMYEYVMKEHKGQPFPAGEAAIARDPRHAYLYALNVLKVPFPAGEAAIAQDAGYAYAYALDVLNGRFPAGEAAIARDPGFAYLYALNVLKAPFPAGEAVIAQNADYALWYARDVLKEPFPLGDPVMAQNPMVARRYQRFLASLTPTGQTSTPKVRRQVLDTSDVYTQFLNVLYVARNITYHQETIKQWLRVLDQWGKVPGEDTDPEDPRWSDVGREQLLREFLASLKKTE